MPGEDNRYPPIPFGNPVAVERACFSSSRAGSERRAAARKGTAQHNASRALVLARREALSKRGKSASNSTKTGAAAVARQINPI